MFAYILDIIGLDWNKSSAFSIGGIWTWFCFTHNWNNICGDGAIAQSTVTKWFVKFQSGNFDLDNQEHPDRPVIIDYK